MNSDLYESDFSDEEDYSDSSESETPNVKKNRHKRETCSETDTSESAKPQKKCKHKKKIYSESESEKKRKDRKILVSTSEDISIEDESVVLLDGNKNTRLILPYLEGEDSVDTNKGRVFTGESITIISKKLMFEHIIRVAENNYINGNSAVYRLEGGKSVVFHPIGNSWYADR